MKKRRSHSASLRIFSYVYQYLFYFFLGSVVGWLWEVLLVYVSMGVFENRGFFHGPWLPVYGVGAVCFYLLLNRFRKRKVFVFVVSLVTGSCVELFVGWLLDHFWGKRYWDYRQLPLDIHGYVCLFSALGFGVAGLIWVCLLSDFLWELLCPGLPSGAAANKFCPDKKLPLPFLWIRIILWTLVGAFLLDLMFSLFL